MTIRKRLILQFTIIVTTIVLLLSLFIYLFYAEFRREEYYSRLYTKALTTARLLIDVQEIDHKLLRIIDKNALNALHNEKIVIYNHNNRLVYSSTDDHDIKVSVELLDSIREAKHMEWMQGMNESLGLTYDEADKHYVVIASAYDIYGRRKLVNLRFILIAGSVVSLIIAFIAGRFFSGQALSPITNINEQVAEIGGDNLQSRINEGNGKDEIAQLASNFNLMLDRIAASFALQKTFVHNASHELRTPLAAIISQIQVGLSKARNDQEYKSLLGSVLEDAQNLTILSNSLLELAQAEAENIVRKRVPVRIDETLFLAQADALRSNPDRAVEISFAELPEEEEAMTVMGNEGMLRTLFINLLDNACKFSKDKRAVVSIGFETGLVYIKVADKGLGIPGEEIEKIFMPFYRADTARQFKGHGLGLSICQRIVKLHDGTIAVKSIPGEGSTFEVRLPNGTA